MTPGTGEFLWTSVKTIKFSYLTILLVDCSMKPGEEAYVEWFTSGTNKCTSAVAYFDDDTWHFCFYHSTVL